jgi:hypothetical protein
MRKTKRVGCVISLFLGSILLTSAAAKTVNFDNACQVGVYNYVNPSGLREAWTYNFGSNDPNLLCQIAAVSARPVGQLTTAAGIAYSATYEYSTISEHGAINSSLTLSTGSLRY